MKKDNFQKTQSVVVDEINTPDEITYREVAVMSAESGTIEIYTLPQKVKTQQDLEDYLYLELEIDNSSEWIAADEILLSDYRTKVEKI